MYCITNKGNGLIDAQCTSLKHLCTFHSFPVLLGVGWGITVGDKIKAIENCKKNLSRNNQKNFIVSTSKEIKMICDHRTFTITTFADYWRTAALDIIKFASISTELRLPWESGWCNSLSVGLGLGSEKAALLPTSPSLPPQFPHYWGMRAVHQNSINYIPRLMLEDGHRRAVCWKSPFA